MFSTLYALIFGRKATLGGFGPTNPPADTLKQDASYKPPEFNTDAYRPIKVRCIGAGFSGIACALRYGMGTFFRVCTVNTYMGALPTLSTGSDR